MASGSVSAKAGDPAHERTFGGEGGVPFDDAVVGGDVVQALWMASGRVIDSLQLAYRNGRKTSRHGGTGGAGSWIAFERGELILGISGRCDAIVEQLTVQTTRRTIAAGVPCTHGTEFAISAPQGYHIYGFRGRCRDFVNAIGVCLAPVPRPPRRREVLARAVLRQMTRRVDLTPYLRA